MEKKMDLETALFIIGIVIDDIDKGYFKLTPTEKKAWDRIKEVIENSEEYKKEIESK